MQYDFTLLSTNGKELTSVKAIDDMELKEPEYISNSKITICCKGLSDQEINGLYPGQKVNLKCHQNGKYTITTEINDAVISTIDKLNNDVTLKVDRENFIKDCISILSNIQ